jgi:FkbM family methyltransferase
MILSNDKPFDLHVQGPQGKVSLHYVWNTERASTRHIYQTLASGQAYEPDVCALIVSALRPGDVFVDVGAHVGFFSVMASKLVGADGIVIAVEPSEDNLTYLERHRELNQCDNIRIIPRVLAADADEHTFFINADNDGGHALWDVGKHPQNPRSAAVPDKRAVQTTTLDDVLAEAGAALPKLIKLDVEGAEPAVIAGAQATLGDAGVPFVISEINEFALNQMGSSQMAYRAQMTGLGYDAFLVVPEQGFPKYLPEAVAVVSRSSTVFNVLFSKEDRLHPFWPQAWIA